MKTASKGVAVIGTSDIGAESGKRAEEILAVPRVENVRPGIKEFHVGRGKLPDELFGCTNASLASTYPEVERRKCPDPAIPPYPAEFNRRGVVATGQMPRATVAPDFDTQRSHHRIHNVCFDKPAFFTKDRAGS